MHSRLESSRTRKILEIFSESGIIFRQFVHDAGKDLYERDETYGKTETDFPPSQAGGDCADGGGGSVFDERGPGSADPGSAGRQGVRLLCWPTPTRKRTRPSSSGSGTGCWNGPRELLEQSENRQEAEALLRGNLLELEALAAEEIAAAGYDYPVTAQLTDTNFPTREYDGVYPAGRGISGTADCDW